MKVQMDFVEISALFNAIVAASKVKFTARPKFRYALAKNRDTLEPFIRQLQEASQLPDDLNVQVYEKYRKELVRQFSDDGVTISPALAPEFLDNLERLQKDHPEGWKMVEEHQESMEEFRKERQDVELYLVNIDLLPEDLDDQMAVNGLFPILDETGQDN
jgi:hypothetical protein